MTTPEEPSTALTSGSMVLLAHHVSATFGAVSMTPAPDGDSAGHLQYCCHTGGDHGIDHLDNR